MSQTGELNAQGVADYLRQHPDFFNQHLDLLENLPVLHPDNGNVVSLVARQLAFFRNRQQKLQSQLNSLIEIARDNDLYANRLHQLTLTSLNSASFETAIAHLVQVLTQCFMAEFVALKIIGENDNPALNDFFISPEHHSLDYVTSELIHKIPRCGCLNVAQTGFLFGDKAAQVKSCAIVPLLVTDFAGLLVIGSRDEDRFHCSLDTLFLSRLSEIISLRLATLLCQ